MPSCCSCHELVPFKAYKPILQNMFYTILVFLTNTLNMEIGHFLIFAPIGTDLFKNGNFKVMIFYQQKLTLETIFNNTSKAISY